MVVVLWCTLRCKSVLELNINIWLRTTGTRHGMHTHKHTATHQLAPRHNKIELTIEPPCMLRFSK